MQTHTEQSGEAEGARVCELDEKIWGVIGFDGPIKNHITYNEAHQIVAASSDNGYFVTTAEAIERAGSSGFRPIPRE